MGGSRRERRGDGRGVREGVGEERRWEGTEGEGERVYSVVI